MRDKYFNQFCFLKALKIVGIFAPCLREEEHGDAVTEVFDELVEMLNRLELGRVPTSRPEPSRN